MLNKIRLLILFLFVIGIISFFMAGFCYWTYRNMVASLAFYGVPETDIYKFEETASTAYQLFWGITKFSIAGIASWVAGLFFFYSRKKNLIKKLCVPCASVMKIFYNQLVYAVSSQN